MNYLTKYILNPAYYLRNDVHRVILGSFDFPNHYCPVKVDKLFFEIIEI